tara:strand:+ start:8309 stop:8746 length:438 start_codon:yes stop_codon:yes gene_type:complete
MLDIGWTEILIIAVITLFVVGPKDIPKVLRTIGIWIGKFKSISRDFQNTVHDAVKEAELDEVKKQIESAKTGFTKEMTETIDSEGELTDMLRGVDVVEEDKNKNSSAWPIPLNEKPKEKSKKEDDDDKIDNRAKSVEKKVQKPIT